MAEDMRKKFEAVKEQLSGCYDSLSYHQKMIELGFEFFVDEAPDRDILEESLAMPQNTRQEQLLFYFENKQEPSQRILNEFLLEKKSDNTNYALIRRYFRAANKALKRLILFGLEQDITNKDLLNDLVFFNEFDRQLDELIAYYKKACRVTHDLVLFKELAKDFFAATVSYDYDAFHALLTDEKIIPAKKIIVTELQTIKAGFCSEARQDIGL